MRKHTKFKHSNAKKINKFEVNAPEKDSKRETLLGISVEKNCSECILVKIKLFRSHFTKIEETVQFF